MKKNLLTVVISVFMISSLANLAFATNAPKVRYSFIDKSSNSNFYILEDNMILLHTGDDTWFKLDDKYTSIYKDPNLMYPGLGYIKGLPFDFSQYYLDIEQKTIFRGNQYYASPNGNWGFKENRYTISQPEGNSWVSSNVHSLLLKNIITGEIEEIMSSDWYMFVSWTKNNKLLICRYSHKEKQKEIIIYNPQDKSEKQITLGTLYKFLPEKNVILFAKNEPARKPWLYTLDTAKERLLKEKEVQDLFRTNTSENQSKTQLPANIDIGKVEKLQLPIKNRYEHVLKIDNKEIPVPFVLNKDHKNYIPIRPLMQGLNLKVKCINPDQNNYQYTLVYGNKSIKVTSKNSIIYLWRLYVPENQLKALGIDNIKIMLK